MTTEEIEHALRKLNITLPQVHNFASVNRGETFDITSSPPRSVQATAQDAISAVRVVFGLNLIEVFPKVLELLEQIKKPNAKLSQAAKRMDAHWNGDEERPGDPLGR